MASKNDMIMPAKINQSIGRKTWQILGIAALSVFLSACVEQDKRDLESYVEEILSRKAPGIPDIPTFPPYQLYSYSSSDAKDPFKPFFEKPGTDLDTAGEQTGCQGPDSDRLREELEAYPLDSLRMVGTIEREEQLYGVILSTEGAIHRVSIDNFLGRNHGRIINIREEAIEILEIVPDGQGCWQERESEIALVE